jgi:hypothetical protein
MKLLDTGNKNEAKWGVILIDKYFLDPGNKNLAQLMIALNNDFYWKLTWCIRHVR